MTATDTLDALHGACLLGDPSAAEKRAALVAIVRECLGRHDAGFRLPGRVTDRIHSGTILDASEADQHAVMGTPARYAEVLWRGTTEGGADALSGGAVTTGHRFLVSVYYGAGDGSEDAFLSLMESTDEAAPGLLAALRATHALTTGSGGGEPGVARCGAPESVVVAYVPARMQRTGRARYQHECAFTITLT